MEYQPTIFVICRMNGNEPCPKKIETSLPLARGRARELALDHPYIPYRVYRWSNGEDWRDHPTNFDYQSFHERADLPIGSAVGALVNSNDDCLRA